MGNNDWGKAKFKTKIYLGGERKNTFGGVSRSGMDEELLEHGGGEKGLLRNNGKKK